MACPGKRNQGLKPAVRVWFNFDPHPNTQSVLIFVLYFCVHERAAALTTKPKGCEVDQTSIVGFRSELLLGEAVLVDS